MVAACVVATVLVGVCDVAQAAFPGWEYKAKITFQLYLRLLGQERSERSRLHDQWDGLGGQLQGRVAPQGGSGWHGIVPAL